jgi:hypothetical protein
MTEQPVKFSFAWNRPFFPIGGLEKVYLLLECKGQGAENNRRAPINTSLVPGKHPYCGQCTSYSRSVIKLL